MITRIAVQSLSQHFYSLEINLYDNADAMEEIHDVFKEAGAKMVGYCSTDGYQHAESKVRSWVSSTALL